jgi:hypothetical protein
MESCERWMPAQINPVQVARIIRRNTCSINTLYYTPPVHRVIEISGFVHVNSR